MSVDERRAAVVERGLPAYRADQIARHYAERFEADTTAWTDLPATARARVAELFPVLLDPVTTRTADRGTTVKTLYRLFDGALLESVVMRYGRGVRSTICVSSQAGCGMRCPFCATGQGGLQRNLSTGEIVEQVRVAAGALVRGDLPGGAGHLANVVFMGMGEPLVNYRAVVAALRVLTTPAPVGLGLSARGITVSTVGLVPRIADLAATGLPVTLAVSLHAADGVLRSELVPLNRHWGVGPLLDAARAYFDATKRRVSIEYALMRDINDQPHHAAQLARALNARGYGWVHVNLIPLNPTPGSRWTASRPADEAAFVRQLETAHVPVTVRDTRGSDIDGACGQLAARVR